MPPPWRWAAVSAGVLAVFALVAIVVSHSGLARTALISMTKASELPAVPAIGGHGADTAGTKKLFAYLSADSYTPQNEESFLAARLGVDDATAKSQALKLRQLKKGKVPVGAEKESKYNVHYFSRFLESKPQHYTIGGMKAAAYRAEQAQREKGFVDDDGVHYLGKAQAEKLSKALATGEQNYLFSENHGILWQTPSVERDFVREQEAKMPAPESVLSRAQDKKLAGALAAGITYADLPDHGAAMRAQDAQQARRTAAAARVVRGAAGKKLAEELAEGQAEALALEANKVHRETRQETRALAAARKQQFTAGKKLAEELAEGEAAALAVEAEQVHKEQQGEVAGTWRADDGDRTLGKQAGERLAAQLLAGQRAALLEPYLDQPLPTKTLDKAGDEKLASELEAGLHAALRTQRPAPRARPWNSVHWLAHPKDAAQGKQAAPAKTLGEAADKKLVAGLEAAVVTAEADAEPQHHSASERARARGTLQQLSRMSAAAVRARNRAEEEEEADGRAHVLSRAQVELLAQELASGREEAIPKLIRDPPRRAAPRYLTAAQDGNVARYLDGGINAVFPDPKPVVHRFLSEARGQQLVRAAKQDEEAEENLWGSAKPEVVPRKVGIRMALEMQKSLAREEAAGGRYVDKYLHRVTGRPLTQRAGPRYIMAGSGQSQKYYNKLLYSNKEQRLAKRLQDGLDWVRKVRAHKTHAAQARLLKPEQTRALGEYLQPAVHLKPGQAPGLGFAV